MHGFVRSFHDIDYAHKLNAKDKRWLSDFMQGHIDGNFRAPVYPVVDKDSEEHQKRRATWSAAKRMENDAFGRSECYHILHDFSAPLEGCRNLDGNEAYSQAECNGNAHNVYEEALVAALDNPDTHLWDVDNRGEETKQKKGKQ